jgi:hypothetical protein
MNGRWLLAAGATLLGIIAGCKFTDMPSLTHPRSATIQQKRALRYDPYPETGIGTDISTVRPREYQIPPAEPTQARWKLDPATNGNRWGTLGRE